MHTYIIYIYMLDYTHTYIYIRSNKLTQGNKQTYTHTKANKQINEQINKHTNKRTNK